MAGTRRPQRPADISLESTPQRREDITSVELDGEVVIYAGQHGTVHKLDPIATVLWNCLDGSVSLRELATDIGEVFASDDPDRIATDLVAYARGLGHQGLLQGVVPPPAMGAEEGGP